MHFARVVSETGLTMVELAALYRVSRKTLYYWKAHDGPRSGSVLDRLAVVITAALLNSVERKLLPLPAMSKDARRKRITAMAKTLQNMKPAPVQ